LLPEALAVARAIGNEYHRARALILTGLAPHLPEVLPEVLEYETYVPLADQLFTIYLEEINKVLLKDFWQMEGTILRFDISNNTGVIRGNDGTRYQFTNSDWKDEKEFPRVGLSVDIYCIPKDKGKRIWQYDGYLVMLRGASLPNRCIKTNRPVTGKEEQTLSFNPLFVNFSALFSALIRIIFLIFVPWIVTIPVIIAYFAMTKYEKITFGLSQEVKKQHRLLTDRIFSCVIFGMIMAAATIHFLNLAYGDGIVSVSLVIFALLCLPFWLILRKSPLSTSGISIVWIQGEYICIRGINKEYLSEFPEWSDYRRRG